MIPTCSPAPFAAARPRSSPEPSGSWATSRRLHRRPSLPGVGGSPRQTLRVLRHRTGTLIDLGQAPGHSRSVRADRVQPGSRLVQGAKHDGRPVGSPQGEADPVAARREERRVRILRPGERRHLALMQQAGVEAPRRRPPSSSRRPGSMSSGAVLRFLRWSFSSAPSAASSSRGSSDCSPGPWRFPSHTR